MDSVVTYKCPNCDSNLDFNPDKQNWDCKYCGSNYDEKRLQELCEISKKEFIDNVNCYHCDGCGANIIANQDVISTTCAYCGSNLILNKEIKNTLKPEKIIPFKINKKKAEKIFDKQFGKESRITNIIGMYVPYWLYSFSSDVYVENFDYDYKYITHFSNIPVDGSININDELAYNVGPFDYSGLRSFSHTYLSGFYSERFTDKTYEAYEKVSKRVTEDIPHILEEVYGSIVKENEYKIVNKMYENQYVLLPVWIINCESNGKKYNCYINAQTGKCVSEMKVFNKRKKKKQKVAYIKDREVSNTVSIIVLAVAMLVFLSAFNMPHVVMNIFSIIFKIASVLLIIILLVFIISIPFVNWKFTQPLQLNYDYDYFNRTYKKKTIKRSDYIVDVGRAKK